MEIHAFDYQEGAVNAELFCTIPDEEAAVCQSGASADSSWNGSGPVSAMALIEALYNGHFYTGGYGWTS
jgi:hypothetical protein